MITKSSAVSRGSWVLQLFRYQKMYLIHSEPADGTSASVLCHTLISWISCCVFIRVQLFCNILLVSATQQSESATCIHISPLLGTSLPFPPILTLQVITEHQAPYVVQQSPTSYLFYTWQCVYIYIIYSQCYSLNLSQPLLPPLCPQVHSLCLQSFLQRVSVSPMTTAEAHLGPPVVSQQHLHTISTSRAWPPGPVLQPLFPIQNTLLLTLRVSTPCPCVSSLYPRNRHFLPFSPSDLPLFCREAPGPLPLVLI